MTQSIENITETKIIELLSLDKEQEIIQQVHHWTWKSDYITGKWDQ